MIIAPKSWKTHIYQQLLFLEGNIAILAKAIKVQGA